MSSHDQREPEAEPGLLDATMVGMGAMISAGIFVLTGLAAEISGAAALLAFLLSGVVAAFTGLSYAELASTIPKSGGGYAFVREIFDDFGTPFVAVLLSAVVMLGFVFLHTQSAGNTSSLFFLLSFMIVNIAVIRLRQEWPNMNCPYKIPYYPIPPILAIALSGVLAVVLIGFLIQTDLLALLLSAGGLAAAAVMCVALNEYRAQATVEEPQTPIEQPAGGGGEE